MDINFTNEKHSKEEKESYNEMLKNIAIKITHKPSIYLEKEDKWILLSILLYNFGANYDHDNKELYLKWNVKDKEHFKFLQRIIDSLIDSGTIGHYNNGVWRILP